MITPVGASAVSEMIVIHNRVVNLLYGGPYWNGGISEQTIRVQADDNGTVTNMSRLYRDSTGTYRITQQVHTTYKIEKVEEK